LGNVVAADGDTDAVPLPKEVLGPQTAWGVETNGFRAGVCWFETSGKMNIRTTVLTFKTNATWNYVAPPGKKFLKCELRDARGMLLTPLKGKKLDGEFSQVILTKDLPHSPAVGLHTPSMIENLLVLPAGLPGPFRHFFIEDVYRIDQEGDYTLTVCVAIYRFAPDRQSVSRIDLPPVTAKIHLRESVVPQGMSSGTTTAYVAGVALCVAGVVWLVARRRRHNAGNAGPRMATVLTS